MRQSEKEAFVIYLFLQVEEKAFVIYLFLLSPF